MAVTMRDVAAKTGVSIRTVSRAINNKADISEATRQRIQQVIEELGYRPNSLARGLVSGKTLSVGLIIPQINDPFFPDVVLGVERVAHQHQHSVFLCNTSEDPQQELYYLDALASKQVDGVILCGTCLTTAQLSQVATRQRVVILTDRKLHHTATVSIQAEAGMYELTSHLINLGHRTIGYISRQEVESSERVDGYYRALREHDLKADIPWCVFVSSANVEAGRQMTKQLLDQIPELTAILCYDDQMAIGAIQACGELGRRVPQDIAVVGFDDNLLASLVTPALTTMRVPRYKLGEMLMELLLQVMAMDGPYEKQLYVQPELIIRESCGTKNNIRSEIHKGGKVNLQNIS